MKKCYRSNLLFTFLFDCKFILCTILILSNAKISTAQIIGSRGNGRSAPAEVKPSEISAGGFSGNVSLFTGTYNTNYTLGTVSTPSGLSFTANLTYSSTFSSGDNMPHVSGIPYGEGWSVELPMISVNTESFTKYTKAQLESLKSGMQPSGLNPPQTEFTAIFSSPEQSEEGKPFWFQPTISIPGVASGKLVYKYTDGNDRVFVLQTFERYIEARTTTGNTWEVVLDDGTRYQFDAVAVNAVNPTNQRVKNLLQKNGFNPSPPPPAEPEYLASGELVLPKISYTQWYCTKIYNRNLTGSIRFEYKSYGCINFFEDYTNSIALDKIDYAYHASTPGQVAEFMKVCKEIYVSAIVSDNEKLVFEHDYIPSTDGENMLQSPPPPDNGDFERLDNLYARKLVKNWDLNFNTWQRYVHLKSDEANGFTCTQIAGTEDFIGLYSINSTNPYMGQLKTQPLLNGYLRKVNSNNNLSVSMKHSFVESDGVSFDNTNFVSGDYYQVNVKISSTASSTWDINLATGDHYFFGQGDCEFLPSGLVNADYMKRTRGINLFSTFNQAIKWHTQLGSTPQEIVTSNIFMMPNLLTSKFSKFYLQVGPGISDNDFAATPTEVTLGVPPGNSLPMPKHSNYGYNASIDPTWDNTFGNPNKAVKSGDPIPQNFGIGLSWFMMENFYRDGFQASLSPTVPSNVRTWWNNCPRLGGYSEYFNIPTRTGENSSVTLAKIYRISKLPYMLKHVSKFVHNPSANPTVFTVDDNWVAISKIKFDYSIQKVDRYATAIHQGMPPTRVTELKDKRNVILLSKIIQLPIRDVLVGFNELSAPTTHLNYQQYLPPQNSNINSNLFVLTKVVDPLGKVSTINYLPLDPLSLAIAPPLPVEGKSYSLISTVIQRRFGEPSECTSINNNPNYDCSVCGSYITAESYAFQSYMVVSSISVQDRDAAQPQVTNYNFSGVALYSDLPSLDGRFFHDQTLNFKVGFRKCTVTEPERNGKRLITKYYHKTNEIPGYLLWGKLYKTEQYDASTTPKLTSKNESKFEVVLAFEPAYHRGYGNPDVYFSDYYDYYFYQNNQFNKFVDRPIFNSIITNSTTELSLNQYYQSLHTFFEIDGKHDDDNANIFYAPIQQTIPYLPGMGGTYGSSAFLMGAKSDFTSLGESSRPFWINSYFIRKVADTVTTYEPRILANLTLPPAGEIDSIVTITEYTYFDADYTGRSTSFGYGEIGLSTQQLEANDPTQYYHLIWEPSWQLHSTRTWSPQMGLRDSAYTLKEMFYFWDLYNLPEHLKNPNDNNYTPKFTGGNYEWMYRLWSFMGMRNTSYETKTTIKIPGNAAPLITSEYTIYKTGWEAYRAPFSWKEVIDPINPFPCPDAPTIFNEPQTFPPPGAVYCEWIRFGDPPPNGANCVYYPPTYYCDCGMQSQVISPDPALGLKQTYQNGAPINPWSIPDVEARNVISIKGMIYPEKILRQTTPSNFGNISHFDPTSGALPVFPEGSTNQVVEHIIERNLFGQVTKYIDVANVLHGVDYGFIRGIEHKACINNKPTIRFDLFNNCIGLPVRTYEIAVGSTQDTFITKYQYNYDNTIKRIINPNGDSLTFGYDIYGRMGSKLRNGTLLQEATYHQWNNDESKTFAERAYQNYVKTKTYVTNEVVLGIPSVSSWTEYAFVDPLGRKVGASKDGYIMEDVIFDSWNQPLQSLKAHSGAFPTITPSSPPATNDVMGYVYEDRPTKRVLKSSKFGQPISGTRIVENNYWFCTASILDNFLTNAGHTSTVTTPRPPGSIFVVTKVEDEDDKYVVEISDAFGRKVASIGENRGTATVFYYDRQGNVARVINPKQQTSKYRYNYLNQLFKKETPDDGTTIYAYDGAGRQIAYKDNRGITRMLKYDGYGRLTDQFRLINNPVRVNEMFQNDGMQWINNLGAYDYLQTISVCKPEKKFYFDYYSPLISSNLTPTNVNNYLSTSGTYALGRLVGTYSYSWENNTSKPVEIRYFSYNRDGFIKWEINQFNYNTITPSAKGIVARFDFPSYTRTGNIERTEIDLDCNSTLDIQYVNTYDSWSRLKTVYANFENLGTDGFKIAELSYDNISGMVNVKKYFDHLDQNCKNVLVQNVSYGYDERFRLTQITSGLLDWELRYDANNFTSHNSSKKNYYNGNINSSHAKYKFSGTVENPSNFAAEYADTWYNYTYDNLNRLTKADCKIIPYAGNSAGLGDSEYAYDKVGNINQLKRYSTDFGSSQQHIYDYIYSSSTNNLLQSVNRTTNGTTVVDRNLTYDNNGNLMSDSKRQLSDFGYGRGNLPFELLKNSEKTQFLYSIDENRIFKRRILTDVFPAIVYNSEFYLRTSTGQDFAIVDFVFDNLTWYASAGERVARFPHPTATTYAGQLKGDPDANSKTPKGAMAAFPSADFTDENAMKEIAGTSLVATLQSLQHGKDSLRLPVNLFLVRNDLGEQVWRLDSLKPTDHPMDTFRLENMRQPIAFVLADSSVYTVPLDELLGLREPVDAPPAPAGVDLFEQPMMAAFNIPVPIPQPVFYLYDHLGNTRVTFYTDAQCGEQPPTVYHLDYAVDYYPYGKILREYISNELPRERYLTTQHERDHETGLDNRGARWYDSDLGRFLSVDPLAVKYAEWGTYCYVNGNPVFFIDLTGKSGDPFDILYQAIGSFTGATTAIIEDVVGCGCKFPTPSSSTSFGKGYAVGNQLGHMGMLATSAGMTGTGTGMMGGGGALAITGVGAPVGGLGIAGGAALTGGGIWIGANALRNLNGDDPVEITIDSKKYPQSAQHAQEAINSGKKTEGVIDRANKNARRKENLSGNKKVSGSDRDEFPPAVINSGERASVKPISPSDNRGAGASIGNQIKNLPDGTKVIIKPN